MSIMHSCHCKTQGWELAKVMKVKVAQFNSFQCGSCFASDMVMPPSLLPTPFPLLSLSPLLSFLSHTLSHLGHSCGAAAQAQERDKRLHLPHRPSLEQTVESCEPQSQACSLLMPVCPSVWLADWLSICLSVYLHGLVSCCSSMEPLARKVPPSLWTRR